MLTNLFAGSFLALGLLFAGASAAEKPRDCCAARLACCTPKGACCAADARLGCCARGVKCCDNAAGCCGAKACCGHKKSA
jgi:hypothetical protein